MRAIKPATITQFCVPSIAQYSGTAVTVLGVVYKLFALSVGFSMAGELGAQGVFASPHFQTCPLHKKEGMKTCSGNLKRGNACLNKAIDSPQPGFMPMCKIHRDQLKMSTFCRAPLSCGFECGRLCEWRPHQFQMCPDHQDHQMTCYFLKIPIEMRLRIYRLLLPDKLIPARHQTNDDMRSDGQVPSMAILRVNRQIYDEAVDVLYSAQAFNVEVSGDGLSMCRATYPRVNYPHHSIVQYYNPTGSSHCLQDYQMQLMLLEQQNKRRLIMARQQQGMATVPSSSGPPPGPPTHRTFTRQPISYNYTPNGPVWEPLLTSHYFNLINSFRICIAFPSPDIAQPVSNMIHRPMLPNALEPLMYDCSDRLHSLVGRLLLLPRPISRLEVKIKLNDNYYQRSEAIYAAQFLLRPFRRLCNVTQPSVVSIAYEAYEGREGIDLLNSPHLSCPDDKNLFSFLDSWVYDLRGPEPAMGPSTVFDAYWKLEKMVEDIKAHYRVDLGFGKLGDLAQVARVAREDGDEVSFRVVWEEVVGVWCEFLEDQKRFHDSVARQIDEVYDKMKSGNEIESIWEEYGSKDRM